MNTRVLGIRSALPGGPVLHRIRAGGCPRPPAVPQRAVLSQDARSRAHRLTCVNLRGDEVTPRPRSGPLNATSRRRCLPPADDTDELFEVETEVRGAQVAVVVVLSEHSLRSCGIVLAMRMLAKTQRPCVLVHVVESCPFDRVLVRPRRRERATPPGTASCRGRRE